MLTHELLTSDHLSEILVVLYEVRDHRDGKKDKLSPKASDVKLLFGEFGNLDAVISTFEKAEKWREENV